ncbi:MAG: hypothetical protein ABIA74_03585, partial [bacterium]
ALTFDNKKAEMFGSNIAKALKQQANPTKSSIKDSALVAGLIKHEDTNTLPVHDDTAGPYLAFHSQNDDNVTANLGPTNYVVANPTPPGAKLSTGQILDSAAPGVAGGWDAAKQVIFFTGAQASTAADVDPLDYTGLKTPANQDTFNQYWVVFGYDAANPTGIADTIIKGAGNWLKQYDENPYQWFAKRDFYFEPDRRQGFGDIDLDLFYEHTFSDEWIAEVMLGVRFPTGPSDDYTGNPFKAHAGNGEHWEIKLGAMAAWMPLDWMNVKLDGYFSFVLEATEQRCAGFKGAEIKNIGPKIDADVDWQYFVIRLDFNLFHPKTDDLSTDIGYEFYYKTRDDVSQKKTKMASWLGRHWENTAATGQPANYGWVTKEFDLDNGVLESNTQAIGHKIRGETSYRFSDWFEMYGGGSYVFAGKNLPRETDMHAGINVRF